MNNRATIYSNGIADFRRVVRIEAGAEQRVTIPVRSAHTADVLASLSVLGPVRFAAPPSFRPRGAESDALAFESDDALQSLVLKLVGARVAVEHGGRVFEGRIVGLQREDRFVDKQKLAEPALVVEDGSGLRKLALREVEALRFVDAEVQGELDKALVQRIESIKPNATFVEFSLVGTSDAAADAIVQYSVPAAAWKISYRLRAPSGHKGGDTANGGATDAVEGTATAGDAAWSLQAFAIVDNNTDEDWSDVLVAVVTGEPITFASDLAEAKTPQRERVNVVAERALGAVEVEASLVPEVAAAGPARAKSMRAQGLFGASAGGAEFDELLDDMAIPAAHDVANAHEVADFCVFECKEPVSIAAQRSAVLPVLDEQLDDARVVFVYRHDDHPERPFRAVEFVPPGPYSLGRGVCSVFDGVTFVGSAVLGPAKPGERLLLPHALETGIRVRRDGPESRVELASLRVAEGVVETHERRIATTRYALASLRGEASALVIEHDFLIHRGIDDGELRAVLIDSEGTRVAIEASERLAHGYRFRCELPPRAMMELEVEERRVERQAVELLGNAAKDIHFDWLHSTHVQGGGVLADRAEIQTLIALQAKVDALRKDIDRAAQEQKRLTERAERLRQNITSVGNGDAAAARWTQDLQALENRLVELEDSVLPAMRKRRDEEREALRAALRALSLEWSS